MSTMEKMKPYMRVVCVSWVFIFYFNLFIKCPGYPPLPPCDNDFIYNELLSVRCNLEFMLMFVYSMPLRSYFFVPKVNSIKYIFE